MSCDLDIVFNVPDVVSLIFHPFQQTEESFFLRLVCKKWYQVIQTKTIPSFQIISHYAKLGSLSSLQLLRAIFNDDKKVFIDNLFAFGTLEVINWALSEIPDINEYLKPIQLGFAKAGHWQLYKQHISPNHSLPSDCSSAAAASGHLDFIQHVHPTGTIGLPWHQVISAASENGHIHILEWLLSDKIYRWSISTDTPAASAAKTGQIHVLEWLKQNGGYFKGTVFDVACRYGQLKVLQWLETNGYVNKSQSCYQLAQSNVPEIIKWGVINLSRWGKTETAIVARSGDLETLKFCVENKSEWDYQVVAAAANIGHFDMVKWAVDNGCPLHPFACESAARGGHFEILKWLLSTGCQMDQNTAVAAAKIGRIDIIQWTIEQGLKWAEEICNGAAEGGQIETIKWLLEQGCPWDDRVCESASKGGHLESLIWCTENGRTMNVSNCLKAASQYAAYKKNIVQWIVDQHTVDYSNVAPAPTQKDIDEFFSLINL